MTAIELVHAKKMMSSTKKPTVVYGNSINTLNGQLAIRISICVNFVT